METGQEQVQLHEVAVSPAAEGHDQERITKLVRNDQ